MVSPLQLNIDSYVTLAEADGYVRDYFRSDLPEYQSWFAASDDNRAVSLRNSCSALDKLYYQGEKAIRGQPLQFPRKFTTFPGMVALPYGVSQYRDNTLVEGDQQGDGLNSAKKAQIVNALYGFVFSPSFKVDVMERAASSIISRKMGNTGSETYSEPTERTSNFLIGIHNPDLVFNILSYWLDGPNGSA